MFPQSPPWPKDRLTERRWAPDSERASSRSRRPYRYFAFLPPLISKKEIPMTSAVAQSVFDAEHACLELNRNPPMASNLEGLARHLLRAESVASSRIEGVILSHRRLARAFLSTKYQDMNAQSVVANVRATEKAMELASPANPTSAVDVVKPLILNNQT